MAFDLLRWRQKSKKTALCMIIACLNDEGEGIRKRKDPDRDWLRGRLLLAFVIVSADIIILRHK